MAKVNEKEVIAPLDIKQITPSGYLSVWYDKHYCLTISYEPTHNCQIFSVGGIETWMIDSYSFGKEKIKQLFIELFDTVDKNSCLIDISEEVSLDFWPKDSIIMESCYHSTNGSRRKIVILANLQWHEDMRTEDTEDWDEDEEYYY